MRRRRAWRGGLLALLATVLALGPASVAHALSTTVTVPSTANLFGAGRTAAPGPGGGGEGVLPPTITLPAGTGRVLAITSATGTIACSTSTSAPPDGGCIAAPFIADNRDHAGLSGYAAPGGGALGAVFLGPESPYGSAPARLDFTGAGRDYRTLAPRIGQTFFVGDGKAAGGVQQGIHVPDGATRLALGIGDACDYNGPPGCYSDNSGQFTVGLTVTEGRGLPPELPAPSGAMAMLQPLIRISSDTDHHPTIPPSDNPPFHLEGYQGFLFPFAGDGLRTLYRCLSGSDRYASPSSGCAVDFRLGAILTARIPGAEALYACTVKANGERFESAGATCEGQGTGKLLGYLPNRQWALYSYEDPGTGDRIASVQIPPGTYRARSTLGFVMPPAAGRKLIYFCAASNRDHFLSDDPNCEGKGRGTVEGAVYPTPPRNRSTRTIYACVQGGERYTLADPSCDGGRVVKPLGALPTTQAVLYRSTVAGEQSASPGVVLDPRRRLDTALGVLALKPGRNRVALYGCLTAAGDQFLSTDAGCERAARRLGHYGWIFSTPPAGDTAPLMACVDGAGQRFSSNDPGCEGETGRRLGYIQQGDAIDDAPRRLRVTLSHRWRLSRRFTRPLQLTLRNVPRDARVHLRCSGRGCPNRKRLRVKRPKRGKTVRLIRPLRRAGLRRGAKVYIRVSSRFDIGRGYRFRVHRYRKIPSLKKYCVRPNSTKLRKRC